MSEITRAFPNILAVDPMGCGCTECIIGEYVPQGQWGAKANAADLAAVLRGDVRNNTYDSLYELVIGNSYSTLSASEFQRVWLRELNENMLIISNTYIDTDSILEQVSWAI